MNIESLFSLEEKDAYEEGFLARYEEGMPVESNPYKKGIQLHEDWQMGWEAGNDRAKDLGLWWLR